MKARAVVAILIVRELRFGRDAAFARRRADVEAAPQDWRRWYRLAASYGDAGDSRRGRTAMRHAIALERFVHS